MNFKEKLLEIITFSKDKPFINKYTLVIFGFLVWVSFFDRYNLVTQYKLSQNVQLLENKKVEYENQLEKALIERDVINRDIEKYGREKYFFHKDNEEIILIK